MSTEQSEGETQTQTAHSQADITQQATTLTPTTQIKKIPSVWLLAKWWLQERGWPVNNRKKPYLKLLSY